MPILSVKSRLVHFLEFLFDLIVLNLLTLLCCIPIITVGAAMTALYRSLFEIRNGNGNIVKGYFKAFIDNIRPGLVLGLILLLISISFFLYVYFSQGMIANGDFIVMLGIVFVAIIFFFPMIFVFPLLAMFDNSALRTLSNAFLLTFRHAGTSLAVLIMYSLPLVILLINQTWFLRVMPLFAMFGFSLPGWFASGFFVRVFAKYSEF